MNHFHLNIVGLVLLGLGSCKKGGEIKAYTVDKEPATSAPEQSNPHGNSLPPVSMPEAQAEGNPHAGLKVLAAPGFSDVAPKHWLEKKRTAMRLASYEIKGEGDVMADISFTALRSAPGSLLANLNRWRAQAGQSEWSDEDMQKSTTSVPTCFGNAVVMDVQGLLKESDPKKDGRIVGAIVEKDGRAWFYKMRGNADLVGREKENFLAWVQSLKPVEEVVPMPKQVTPQDLSWKLPTGWTAGYGGESRYATIEVPGADEAATSVVVSFFPGDVGGDVANVNRWRAQLSLPPLGEAEVTALMKPLTVGGKPLKLVDLKGPEKRMLAAWTRHGENTWFFKWTGTDAVLEARQAEFQTFLESVRFNTTE